MPPDDPCIKKAAAYIRKRTIAERYVYGLSLSLIFLERLGHPEDMPLIDGAALRLIAAQSKQGGWAYYKQNPAPFEEKLVEQLKRYVSSMPKDLGKPPEDRKPRHPNDVPEQVFQTAVTAILDNNPHNGSTTQFAMLALWVARRHGVPTDRTFQLLERAVRASQNKDGGWAYGNAREEGSTPAMTCMGLLGLAIAHGSKKRPENELLKDRAITAGIDYLEKAIDGKRMKRGNFYYFLFSLERMAVVYHLKKIGKHDWYLWGAKQLVDRQSPNGNWNGKWRDCDTCFALLFLRKANVARDLTQELQGKFPDLRQQPAEVREPPNRPDDDPFKLPKFIRKKPNSK